MKKSALGFITMTSLLLASCSSWQPTVGNKELRPNTSSLPDDFSLFILGRTWSKGAVDIFDPWLKAFDIPLDSPLATDPFKSFDKSNDILVRDGSVNVYSLDKLSLPSPPPVDEFTKVIDGVKEPIPVLDPSVEIERF